MNHDQKCLERQEKYKLELAEYVALWPNYCRTCGGTGILSYTENQSPLGSGMNWPMQMTEPCDECGAVCPRCGYPIYEECGENYDDDFFDGLQPCPSCYLVIGETPSAPVDPECWCGSNPFSCGDNTL